MINGGNRSGQEQGPGCCQTDGEAAITEENKTIDRKVKSICRGC